MFGTANEVVWEIEYPDLATFQRENEAFYGDVDAMEQWRRLWQHALPEKSGGSPIAMDGMGKKLHQANLIKLYRAFKEEQQRTPPSDGDVPSEKKPRARRKGSDSEPHSAGNASARKRVAKKREPTTTRS